MLTRPIIQVVAIVLFFSVCQLSQASEYQAERTTAKPVDKTAQPKPKKPQEEYQKLESEAEKYDKTDKPVKVSHNKPK